MKKREHEEHNGLLLWSALALMVGFLIMVFGASLRSQFSLSQGYSDAVHIRIAPGLVMIIGIVIAIVGVFGIVADIMRRR